MFWYYGGYFTKATFYSFCKTTVSHRDSDILIVIVNIHLKVKKNKNIKRVREGDPCCCCDSKGRRSKRERDRKGQISVHQAAAYSIEKKRC
jgi:hypothetical protein